MSRDSLAYLNQDPTREEYVPCQVQTSYLSDEQKTFPYTGCRYKGSVGSLRICVDATTRQPNVECRKLSWKIDYNKYEEEDPECVDDAKGVLGGYNTTCESLYRAYQCEDVVQIEKQQKQLTIAEYCPKACSQCPKAPKAEKLLGMKQVLFGGMAVDIALMSERVVYGFQTQLGMRAPRVAHVNIYINSVYDGLYSNVEAVDDTWAKQHFADDAEEGKGGIYRDAWLNKPNIEKYAAKLKDGEDENYFLATVAKELKELDLVDAQQFLDKYFDAESIVNVSAINSLVGATDDWRVRHNFMWYVRADYVYDADGNHVMVPKQQKDCNLASTPCGCVTLKGCGWSTGANKCVNTKQTGSTTDCNECKTQKICEPGEAEKAAAKAEKEANKAAQKAAAKAQEREDAKAKKRAQAAAQGMSEADITVLMASLDAEFKAEDEADAAKAAEPDMKKLKSKKLFMVPWDYDRINDEAAADRLSGEKWHQIKNTYDPACRPSLQKTSQESARQHAVPGTKAYEYWVDLYNELPDDLDIPIQCDKLAQLWATTLKDRIYQRVLDFAAVITEDKIDQDINRFQAQIASSVQRDYTQTRDFPDVYEWRQGVPSLARYLKKARSKAVREAEVILGLVSPTSAPRPSYTSSFGQPSFSGGFGQPRQPTFGGGFGGFGGGGFGGGGFGGGFGGGGFGR